jgi:DNA repair protein RadC
VELNSATQVLYVQDGCDFREADDQDVVSRAQELIARRFRRGLPVLANPWAVRSFLQLRLAPSPQMCFAALFLDQRKRLLAFQDLFKGTIDEVTVHPREVVRDALACNAGCAILVRSDPSGDAIFSATDSMIWRRVSQALDVADITALDYMLVGTRVVSCADEGWISTKREFPTGLPVTFGADAMNQSAIDVRRRSNHRQA